MALVHSEVDLSKLTVERWPTHEVFNRLSLLHPLILVDCRRREDYMRGHIRDSIHWEGCSSGSSAMAVGDAIVQALEARPKLALSCIVFVAAGSGSDNSPDAAHAAAEEEALRSRISQFLADGTVRSLPIYRRIHSLSILAGGYAAFRAAYCLCDTLFVSAAVDGSPVSAPAPTTTAASVSAGAGANVTADVRPRPSGKQHKLKSYPTEILPGHLYLGDGRQATDPEVLTHLRITHVVDATGERQSASVSASLGMEYLDVPVIDNTQADIAAHFDRMNAFLIGSEGAPGTSDCNRRILIHCRAGISRSTALVLAYLMHTRLCASLREAFHLVLQQRPFVCPNPAFRRQLREYELALLRRRGRTETADNGENRLDEEIIGSFPDDSSMQTVMSGYLDWMVVVTSTSIDDFLTLHGTAVGMQGMYDNEEYLRSKGAFGDPEGGGGAVGRGDDVAAAKPKKPFLRRGQGKTTAIRTASRRSPSGAAAPGAPPVAPGTVDAADTASPPSDGGGGSGAGAGAAANNEVICA